jgi:hypothetical protein
VGNAAAGLTVARPFVATADGVEARLDSGEALLLRELCADLADRLGDVEVSLSPEDPVLARLFPDGYRDDPLAAAELRSLIQDDLRDAKIAAAHSVVAALNDLGPGGRVRLDEDAAQLWLTALNDLRLTLGTRLDVTEDPDDDLYERELDDPERFAYDIYLLLGWLQDSLVEALSAR